VTDLQGLTTRNFPLPVFALTALVVDDESCQCRSGE
jgi:hypothetical protein